MSFKRKEPPTTLQGEQENSCVNCDGDHPLYAKTCEKRKREKEILSVKYTRKISFLEARKIVDATNRDKTYSQMISSVTSTEPKSCPETATVRTMELVKLYQKFKSRT